MQSLCEDLRVETVAHELFDDASVRYDAWRDAVIDFVLRHWDEVMETESWKEVRGIVRREDMPGAAAVLLKLMERKLAAAATPVAK